MTNYTKKGPMLGNFEQETTYNFTKGQFVGLTDTGVRTGGSSLLTSGSKYNILVGSLSDQGDNLGSISLGNTKSAFSNIAVLDMGGGNDSVNLSFGQSTTKGGAVLWGGDGNDSVTMTDLNVQSERTYFFDGGAGDDLYFSSAFGRHSILGGEGNDTIWSWRGEVIADGGKGNDYILAHGNNAHNFIGGDGNDTLVGGNTTNDVDGDTIAGSAGNDVIYGNDGSDILTDDAGNNTLYGGAGNDYVASRGNSMLYGGAGDDFLTAGGYWLTENNYSEAVTMDGGEGNDNMHILHGVLTSGDGADIIWLDRRSDVVVKDFDLSEDVLFSKYDENRMFVRFSETEDGNLMITGQNPTPFKVELVGVSYEDANKVQFGNLGPNTIFEYLG